LNDCLDDDTKLWENIKPFLRDYENKENGCIIVDDSLLHKPYSKVNDIICWHFEHVSVKGVMMLNFQYTDDTGISIPLGYEIITKTQNVWNEEYQKYIKKVCSLKMKLCKINCKYYILIII
jgi:hypothetical protein